VGRALDADVEVAVKDVAELDIRQRRRIATQKPTRVEAPLPAISRILPKRAIARRTRAQSISRDEVRTTRQLG
jgi:hypothetical protein